MIDAKEVRSSGAEHALYALQAGGATSNKNVNKLIVGQNRR
jgi:hypothetical protein